MLLQIQSVNTYYGKVQALHSVSLHVAEGEIVTLIGANGAGKSTLLMSICGDPRPSSGSITFDGAELVGLETPAIIHKGIAIAPEGRRVFARLTVEENLAMGAFFASDAARSERMERVLRLFPRLKERFARFLKPSSSCAAKASPSSSWSRTPTRRCAWPTGATCWKTVASLWKAAAPPCLPTSACAVPIWAAEKKINIGVYYICPYILRAMKR